MGEAAGSSITDSNFLESHWLGWKGFWCDRFAFLDNYTRFTKRENPVPAWTDADVEAFLATDPVNGPIVKTCREAVKVCATGSAVGAVSTAGLAWKYSRSPHGAKVSLKSKPYDCVNPLATSLALYLSSLPSALNFGVKTHLHPTTLFPDGRVVISQVELAFSASNSSSTASFQPGSFIASYTLRGALLALGAGAVFGWTFGQEIANHAYQLYRLDTLSANVKFMEWWEHKNGGGSS